MQAITSALSRPLYSVAATRQIEQQAAAGLPPHALMQRAGLAVARLTLALAPHARRIWIACGPGNNGGDGFEAALHLRQWGKAVVVTWTGPHHDPKKRPGDAQAAMKRALAAGVTIATEPPQDFDFCIDALLGIGAKAASLAAPAPVNAGLIAQWLQLMHRSGQPVLAVDVPTGLDADTGFSGIPQSEPQSATNLIATDVHSTRARSRFTLSLLTLKPGLFTAHGRDLAGQVWFDDLGVPAPQSVPPGALLLGADRALPPARVHAPHASHKGSFGDVAVVGGESTATASMAGAALLAARAALHAGAGRVFVALLGQPALTLDTQQPELMFRSPDVLDLKQQVVVCGCGGGASVKTVLARVLSSATRAVLDADALNAIAADTQLQTQLKARKRRGYSTILTPHPLEAARLLGSTSAQVQASRLTAAQQLAEQFQCVVALKGSGTVIAAPARVPAINPTGNARLATAGTGDVLAGMMGALLASGENAFDAACSAVFTHGKRADDWPGHEHHPPLTASALATFAN
ncbi:NAD(P)H-hydrate dehydratase [Polaromonas sp.]|uniref:NAD(P)H-hydrate dehydratase n=1 Tax=Polaromonas sp. TaxID=1869339 RepID=UPI002FCB65FF